MIKDIALDENYKLEWDKVILDALTMGYISHARVQMQLGVAYISAAILIKKTIEYGYFDEMQRSRIAVEEYMAMIRGRG